MITAALASFDEAQRERLLQEATRLAIADTAIISLYFQVNTWATRDGIRFTPGRRVHPRDVGAAAAHAALGEILALGVKRLGFHAYNDETDIATVLDIAARLAPS